jgi:hypothetical protein
LQHGAKIKGRIHFSLKAELAPAFLERMESLKKIYLQESEKKLESLKTNLEIKQTIIQ